MAMISARDFSFLSMDTLGASLAYSSSARISTRLPMRRRAHATNGYLFISAKTQNGEDDEEVKDSFFTGITNALDFTAVRSERDAQLLAKARTTIKTENRMTREQYAALKRKVGGTAKSYFKEFIEVDGKYTDDGWVDKTCKYCKKDTSRDPRQKDSSGRYAHIECASIAKSKGNFITRLFG